MSLTIFGISKSRFQRKRKKIPLLVRTFRSDLSTSFGKLSSYTSRKTFTFSPCTEEFPFKWTRWETLFVHSCFQMVAGETKLFMRASSAIFQNVSSSGSRRDLRFGKCPQKKSLPVVPTRKAFLEAFQEKSQKNNSAQVGQNFQSQLPDNLSGI